MADMLSEDSGVAAFYRLMLNNLPGFAVVVFDRNMRFLVAEGLFLETLGYIPAKVIGKTLDEVVPPERVENVRLHYQSALDGKTTEFEATSGEFYYWARIVPVRNGQGEIVAGMAVSEDITARKRAEQALQASEARYRFITEASSDLVLQLNAAGECEYVSPSSETILGYQPAEMLGKTVHDFSHPDDEKLISSALSQISPEGSSLPRLVMRVRHKDGHYIWLESTGSFAYSLQTHVPLGFTVSCRDVTDRILAEQALQESEARYRFMMENSSDLIMQLNLAGEFTYVSPSSEVILGYQPAEMLGKTAHDFAHPDDEKLILAVRSNVPPEGSPVSKLVARIRHKDGHYMWLERTGRLSYSPQTHELIGATISCRDVTDRIRAEQALRESQTQFNLLMENSLDGIVLGDSSGNIYKANPAACKMFGRTEAELRTVGREAVFDQADPKFTAFVQEVIQMGRAFGEITGFRADGTRFPIEASLAVLDLSAEPRRAWNIIRDISDRKRYQQAVIDHEKLQIALQKETELSRLKSRMTERVAHEFRTPFTSLVMLVESLTYYADRLSTEKKQEKLAAIHVVLRRLTDMLDELSITVKGKLVPDAMHPAFIDLCVLCHEVASGLESQFAGVGRFAFQLPASLVIRTDPFVVKNAILHLMRNAARFSKPTDNVLVTLRTLDNSVELCVKDSGIGILPSDQPRVFEPFFRGSNINEIGGLGLGLAIARDSVEACGGTISLESVPDHGTTICLRLPRKADDDAVRPN